MAAILIQTEVAVAKRMSRQFRASVSTGAHRLPVLRSLVHALSALGERLAALVSPKGGSADEQEASDQFSSVLSTEADMSKDEEKLIRGAISLPRRTVRDVMVPRLAIVGVEMGTPWSEMLDRVRSSEHSRLPAYRESLDDVVGVIVAKDLLPYAITGKAPAGGWESLVRPASFVPATKAVADQLREFRSSRTHMAIVVDEYGGTAGILTIEDVLEEVVGEIRDEHDVEEPPVVSESGSRFWVSGRLPVDELEEIIGERLDEVQATTVGGLVFERKGKVPRVGEELVWGNFRVVVERMKRRAVDRVYLERLSDREKVE
jgi:CBS domain containing-hemolysin-like protein